MTKMILKHSLLAGITVFAVAIATPVVVGAQDGHDHSTGNTIEERKAAAQQKAVERKEAMQAKLADAKLKACQNRQKAITNIMTRMTERAEKRVTLFDTITERTKTFYERKGKTLTNYDALVADVEAKKAIVQAEIAAAKSTTATFDCNGEDPKGVVNSFKASAKTGQDAMKAYKTSIKNLIVGVKSVQGVTSSQKEAAHETAQ